MSRPEDDAEASTMAVGGGHTLVDRSSRPALEQLGPGSMVGRYQLEARLGAGAMGVVWSAKDPELDRKLAIKLVHPALHSDESASRFRREARAMAKLSHRAVIMVFDTGVVDGQLWLAMELVRGTTLGQLLRERDAAASSSRQESRVIGDWSRWLAMMLDAGRGLAEAHRNGVLHRDFKPDNVLVDKTGRVCVGDFGLATLGDRGTARPSSPVVTPISLGSSVAFDLTTTGAVLGTPLYMSPQQLNAEAIDERADQFAFCVALHEAMYGHRPFSTEAQGLAAIPSLIEKIAAGVPEPPAKTTVPRGIHDCLVRGLAFEPENRWPDMDALLAALERAGRQRGTTVIKPPSLPRAVWLALGGATLIAFVVVTLLIRRAMTSQPPVVAGGVVAREPVLTKLFSTPLNTRTTISPDGRFLALASDQLEVRSIDGDKPSTSINTLPLPFPLLYLEVDDQEVRYSTVADGTRWRWRYREGKQPVAYGSVPGRWRGSTVAGELVRVDNRSLAIAKPDGTLERWPVQNIEIVTISPDRKRVAYVEGGRFKGTISVRDVTTGRVVTSKQIDEPMAVTWFGPTTLLYASSTMIKPKILRVEVEPRFGEPTVIFTQPTGWFSDLGFGGGAMFIVSMSPTPRGRILERGTTTRSNNELDSVSLAIGWDSADRMVTWNRANQQISSHTGKLENEPANATRSGDTMIAAIRDLGGRRAVAVSLTTGEQRWQHADKQTIAVRCAGDRGPPCFAIRYVNEDLDRVVTIDPETGTLGDTAIFESRRIEDIAVRHDGQALLITQGAELREIKPDGTLIAEHPMHDENNRVRLNLIRSVAYSKAGFMVAGTIGRNAYQVGEMRNGVYSSLDNAYDKILMLVRPSSDASRIVFVARGYEPELYQLTLP